jgi:hypothetical protein
MNMNVGRYVYMRKPKNQTVGKKCDTCNELVTLVTSPQPFSVFAVRPKSSPSPVKSDGAYGTSFFGLEHILINEAKVRLLAVFELKKMENTNRK